MDNEKPDYQAKVHACGAEKKAAPGSALWLVSVLCLFILILANILIP